MQAGFFSYLKDLLLWIPLKLMQGLLEGLAAVLNAIPVPEFFSNAGSYLSALPSGLVYFAQSFQLGYGITVIVSAYVLRFLIRRIPFIG